MPRKLMPSERPNNPESSTDALLVEIRDILKAILVLTEEQAGGLVQLDYKESPK